MPTTQKKLNNRKSLDFLKKYCLRNEKREALDFYSTLFILLSLVLICIYSTAFLLQLMASIGIGLVYNRLFSFYHEYAHGIISTNSRVARVVYFLFGNQSFFTDALWRDSHNLHHKHVGKISGVFLGYFPMATVKAYKVMSYTEKLKYGTYRSIFGWFMAPIIHLGLRLKEVVKAKKSITQREAFLSLLQAVVLILLIYACLGWPYVLLLWIIPFLILDWLGYLVLYIQHNFNGVQYYEFVGENYIDRIIDSSNTILMSRFWRWVFASSGYHMIHHINPKIPYYRLKEAHEEFSTKYEVKETKFGFYDIMKSFDQKLFDPETKKTINWSDYRKIF